MRLLFESCARFMHLGALWPGGENLARGLHGGTPI